jgi:putative SOS response-associated peptidase YedK
VTYLAGLYRIEEERGLRYPVFTVLTKEPGEILSKIHNRMPVILPEDAIDDWIKAGCRPRKNCV